MALNVWWKSSLCFVDAFISATCSIFIWIDTVSDWCDRCWPRRSWFREFQLSTALIDFRWKIDSIGRDREWAQNNTYSNTRVPFVIHYIWKSQLSGLSRFQVLINLDNHIWKYLTEEIDILSCLSVHLNERLHRYERNIWLINSI